MVYVRLRHVVGDALKVRMYRQYDRQLLNICNEDV